MAIRLLSGETVAGNIRTGTSTLTANTNFDNLVIEGSAHTGITIFSGTSSDGAIYFGDSSAADGQGQIKYAHGSDAMTFTTNDGAASLTLDSGLNATFGGSVGINGGVITLGVADTSSGHINAYENMTFNMDIDNDDTTRYFGFYTNGSDGGGTELLKIEESGNATFAGDVVIGESSTAELKLKKTEAGYATIRFDNDSVQKCYIQLDAIEDMIFYGVEGTDLLFYAGADKALTLSDANATFAGNVSLGDNKELIFGGATDFKIYHNSTTNVNHVSSQLDRQLSINGNIINLTNQANDSTYLLLNSSGATFAGDVTLAATKTLKYADDKIKIGGASNTPGAQGIQIGYAADSTGAQGIGMGYAAEATGNQSIAMGYNPTASGTYSQAFGYNVTASGSGTVVFGTSGSHSDADTFVLSGLVLKVTGTGASSFVGDIIVDGSNGSNGLKLLRPTDSAEMTAISAPDSSTLKIGGGNQTLVKIFAHTTEVVEFNNSGNASFAGDVSLADSKYAIFGAGDLKIHHNGTDSFVQNYTGHLTIQNAASDKNIYFQADDGSGGVTTYMKIDGLSEFVEFDKMSRHMDNVQAQFGTSGDSAIYHSGTDWEFVQYLNEGDITFRNDDGSTGTTPYFAIDGGVVKNRAYKDINFNDGVKASFGNVVTPDLEIYHDGSNSYINETGTGNMYIQFYERLRFQDYAGGSGMIAAFNTDSSGCQLYYQNALKLQTTTDGIEITGTIKSDYGGGAAIKTANNGYFSSYTTGGTEVNLLGISNGDQIYIGSIVPGINTVNIRTNGVEAIIIDGSQNVEISNGSFSIKDGSSQSEFKIQTQLTASVGTSATTILTTISDGMSSATVSEVTVYGNNNASAGFYDVLLVTANAERAPQVITALETSIYTAHTRTYTNSGNVLQLAMGATGYNVNVKSAAMGFPF